MKLKPVLTETTNSNIVKILEDTISFTTTPNILGGKYFDIILVDPEAEIVEGDYILNPEENIIEIYAKNKQNISKYIYYKITCGTNVPNCLNKLSEQSIKLLIDYYNEHKCMPEWIEIDYTPYYETNMVKSIEGAIKLNQQGKVDITITEVKEKLYTEEEVLFIIDEYDEAKWGCSARKGIIEITKWFNQNKTK